MKVRICPDGLWGEWANRDATATFFQTRAWYFLIAPYVGGGPCPLLFEAGPDRAVLPLFRRKRLFWDFYFSPFGTYSALLGPDALPPGFLAGIGAWLDGKNVELFSSPFALNRIRIGRGKPNATYLIDLHDAARKAAAPESIASGWAKNQLRYLRKGREAGIAVRQAASASDLDEYLRIYGKARERWGKRARSHYPDGMFQSIWNTLKDSDSMRFWLAEVQGRIVGGDLCFYHNRHAVQWHGVVDPEFYASGTNQVLLRHILTDAAARGFSYYDMNPSGGLESVEDFKKSFGSRRVEFENCVSLHSGYAWIRKLKGLRGFRPSGLRGGF